MRLLIILSIIAIFSSTGYTQTTDSVVEKKSMSELIYQLKQDGGEQNAEKNLWTVRKMRATVLSAIIPGTGQTYLGSELKGVGLTIGFAGTAIAAIINHNNFCSREDRITNLYGNYKLMSTYAEAEKLWQEISVERAARDKDFNRRKYFSYAAVAIWIYNMIDIVYLTEDAGAEQFSVVPQAPVYALSNPHATNQILSIKINLF